MAILLYTPSFEQVVRSICYCKIVERTPVVQRNISTKFLSLFAYHVLCGGFKCYCKPTDAVRGPP